MEQDQLLIAFVKASGGPSVFTPESQAERKAITDALATANVPFDYPQRAMTFDSVSDLLEIVVAATTAFHALRPVMIAWINGRAGQTVRIVKGSKCVEAPSIEEAERAWRLISPAKKIDDSK